MTSAQAGLVLQHIRRLAGPRTAGPADAQLLERFTTQRDEAAFAALVRRHGPMVLNVCRSVLHHEQDAEDAFQATFLLLARKAEAIRQPGAVAGWLAEVAYRVAVKAQADAARRRAQERRATPMPPADPTLDMTLRDLQRVLHEELRRLPEKYRLPLVLCYLEDCSHEEAAGQLGWSKGTLRGRLDRGREHLRRRLAARGVALSALLCATAVAPRAAAEALVDSVVRAAIPSARGGAAADALSARVSALAEGVGRTMSTSKGKVITAVLLVAGLVAGAAALARPAGSPKSAVRGPRPAPGTKETAKPQAADEKGSTLVSGRVVDPAGKPFAGAKVFFVRSVLGIRDAPPAPPAAVSSDGAGSFRLIVSRTGYKSSNEKAQWSRGAVVAVGKGFGPGWVGGDDVEKLTNVTIKLARDVPIQGRVVDLEGRPIAGVQVQVRNIRFRENGGDLKAFVADLRSGMYASGQFLPGFAGTDLDPALLGLTRPVLTGADGKFRFRGISPECRVSLRFAGPTIETVEVWVLTHPTPTIRVPRHFVFYGATFDHAAAPTRPVVGVVRDRDTGKPLAGVTIQARLPSALGHRDEDKYLRTTTDGKGRYRLVGLSRQKGHRLQVLAGPSQPYLHAARTLGAATGLGPVTVDFPLKRGVWFRGRVTDKETGRPVRARVRYAAFSDNPHVKEAPGLSNSDDIETRTAADGSFTLLGLPGRGLLAAKAADRQDGRYVMSVGAEKIKGPMYGRDNYNTEPRPLDPSEFNVVVEVNPARGTESIVRDLALDPGKTVTGTIVGPDGKPVPGCSIDSVRGLWFHVNDLPTAQFRIPGLDPKHPRWFFFLHHDRNLGTAVLLKGNEPLPVTVRLQKCGTVTGRLVDEDGLPRSAWISGFFHRGQLGLKDIGRGFGMGKIGKDGRFRIGVLPGLKVGLLAGKNPTYFDSLVRELTLKPGEVKDVGDVKAKEGE
jgi:RNA polymerase sigma factor (sigma-70 family)